MKKKIIGGLVGIFIIISSISIGFIIYNNNIPKLPEPTIATDDVMIVQYWEGTDAFEEVSNPEILLEGYNIFNGNLSDREWYRVWIQFDLSTKPKYWNKCELRVHVVDFTDDNERGRYGFRVYVNSTWYESMNRVEFIFNEGKFVDWDFMDINIVRSTMIILYDVSEHIENSYSITVSFYIQNAHLIYPEDYLSDMYFEKYSKDSDISKEYMPQLIWG